MIRTSFSQTILLVDPYLLRKITTDPHIIAHVNTVSEWQVSKINNYISEVILDSYKYIQAAYVAMHCMIWH